ncbi:MAG: acetoacetate--CoA ligase [Gammaproteobacteria bacterium]|nr:acetoacetate--CoA ligase [Gammaproteobacteria bacterium]
MATQLWSLDKKQQQHTNMWRFMSYVNRKSAQSLNNYQQLYQWSITCKASFWSLLWKFCDIQSSAPWDAVITQSDAFPYYQWFKGSRLNFAENLLRLSKKHQDKDAIVFWGENNIKRSLTYQQLYTQTTQLARSLQALGVKQGDCVAALMPNLPETIVAMLATSSIGAIWTACSPDFGYRSVLDRFGQTKPKVLFCSDGYFFKSKTIDYLETVEKIATQINSIRTIVVTPYTERKTKPRDIPNACLFNDLLKKNNPKEFSFVQLPFEHPLYILYSSGTTGKPKCIVHGAGGTLIQHMKELMLHTDITDKDRIFYFTTCGWMMWNWLVSNLALGATVMLYDGSPLHPKNTILFDYAEQENITIFGTSAKYLNAIEKADLNPSLTHKLASLRTILSTGSPLAPESFDYVYNSIKTDVQLCPISGGTDIISCFALGNPLLPVHRGELQCRGLGMDVQVFDALGNAINGQKGELVCKLPFPSSPLHFWNDPGHLKYQAAYFSKYNGIWSHGDYAELTSHEGLIIYGRSDTVLNPGGVRIGTAEIYRPIETLTEVLDCIAIAQQWQNDTRIILFVKIRPELTLDTQLKSKINKTIRKNTTPRHVPSKIIQVNDIPKTISGKTVELAVTDIIHNRPVKNIDALANPEALEQFKHFKELQEN